MNKMIIALIVGWCGLAIWAQDDGIYQWAVDVKGVVSKETKRAPRAYLWIPPQAAKVRAVVISQQNMLEEAIFAHREFRAELAKADVGIVWVGPMIPQNWEKLEANEVSAIETLMDDFAELSGHGELKTVPLCPFGHSAMATYPYNFAAARPERTLCAVSIKGDWPEQGRSTFGAIASAARTKVPLLLISGEYEDGYNRREKARHLYEQVPEAHFSMWVDVGGGHFDWSDELCRELGKYFALMARKGIKGTRGEGVKDDGFWFPCKEVLKIVRDYEALPRGKGEFTVLGYEYEGKILEQNPKAHLQVIFGTHGMEFEVKPVFDTKVPEGRPVSWTGLAAGSENPRPRGQENRLLLQKIQGSVERIEGNRWAVRYNRYDPEGNRPKSASLQVVYPGDKTFKRTVQQGEIKVPWPRKDFRIGETVAIDRNFTKAIPAGYGAYVREGPATIENGRMILRDIPKKCKSPLKIVLVTYDLARKEQPVVTTYEL